LDKLKKDGIINPLVKVSCTLRTRPTPPCNPYFIEEDSSLTQWIISLISREGETVRCGIGRSVADENRIAALGIPTYIIPPRGGDSHTNSEWVILDSIVTISNTFKSICESKDLIAILD